jgi:tetratricopeptide (TPR) repeat protein
LDPEDADYYYFVAAVHFDGGRRREALRAAEDGLRHDPRHLQCANLRGLCLAQMGNSAEAAASIERALEFDPEYYWSHENRARLALDDGEVEKAFTHYREALRLNPNSEAARDGLVRSLKSRNRAYRFLFWMSDWSDERHSTRRLGVVGAAIGVLTLLMLSLGAPFPQALVSSVFLTTMGIFVGRWLFRTFAESFFVFLLRFDEMGRRALTADEIRRANFTVGSTAAAVGLIAAAVGFRMPLLGAAAVLALLSPFPLDFIFRQPRGSLRLWATLDYLGFAAATAVLTVLSFVVPILGFLWMIHGVAAAHRLIVRRADFRRAVAHLS